MVTLQQLNVKKKIIKTIKFKICNNEQIDEKIKPLRKMRTKEVRSNRKILEMHCYQKNDIS